MNVLLVAVILLAFFPVVLLHELGHLIIAAWRGARGFTIAFGHPDSPITWTLPVPGLPIRFHLDWRFFFTPPHVRWEKQPRWRPWESLILSAAGPAASLALFWLLGGSLFEGIPLFLQWRYPVNSVADAFQFHALMSFLVPLFPMRYRSLDGMPSDGLCIIFAIRDMLRPAQSRS